MVTGRPRSEQARRAVLHAVDDLLVDVGYAAMTMKGIAERAGVGRQTVYRWWPSKADILLEACVHDAADELVVPAETEPLDALAEYLSTLTRFLTESHAGLAYRALVGEAQHDPAVRDLVRAADPLGAPTRAVIDRARPFLPAMGDPDLAAAQLIGPCLAVLLTQGVPLTAARSRAHVDTLITCWSGSKA